MLSLARIATAIYVLCVCVQEICLCGHAFNVELFRFGSTATLRVCILCTPLPTFGFNDSLMRLQPGNCGKTPDITHFSCLSAAQRQFLFTCFDKHNARICSSYSVPQDACVVTVTCFNCKWLRYASTDVNSYFIQMLQSASYVLQHCRHQDLNTNERPFLFDVALQIPIVLKCHSYLHLLSIISLHLAHVYGFRVVLLPFAYHYKTNSKEMKRFPSHHSFHVNKSNENEREET